MVGVALSMVIDIAMSRPANGVTDDRRGVVAGVGIWGDDAVLVAVLL